MKRILSVLHWLNVDTAIGAVITSMFIAKNLHTHVSIVAFLALFLAVLSIYNFDHLLDSQRIKGVAISGRHRYYQYNFKTLSIYQLVLLIALLLVSWYVPAHIAQAGIILSVIALIYFLLLFIILPKRFLLKEVFISIVYVSGLVLAPLATTNQPILSVDLILWLQIFLLALSNTIILSWFDFDIDAAEGHVSLVQLIGKKRGYKTSLGLLSFLGILIIFSLLNGAYLETQLIIAGMGLALLITLMFSSTFRKSETFRVVGDAIFILPIISLFA